MDTGIETLTAERLLRVKPYINSDIFMATYGDGVGNIPINDLIEFHKKKRVIGTITGVHPKSKWGLVISDKNNIVERFEQKPQLNQYVNGGFMVFDKKVFDYVKPKEMIEVSLNRLVEERKLAVYIHDGYGDNVVKKVIVTGDRGYIGSVLVPKLLTKGYKVVGFDTGFFDKCIIKGKKDPVYKKIKKDIRNITEKDLKGVDAIIHLSALSNDPMGEIDPSLTEEINYKSSIRLAKLAKESGVKKFLFSSSCSIYGIAKSGIVDEKSTVNPLTAYAKSKLFYWAYEKFYCLRIFPKI